MALDIDMQENSKTRRRLAAARKVAFFLVLFAGLHLLAPSISVRARQAGGAALLGEPFPGYIPIVFDDFMAPTVYGVEESLTTSEVIGLIQELGSRWIRNNGLLWSAVEPVNNGGYDWSAVGSLEFQLKATQQAGMQTILIVRSTPDWAQKFPGEACGPMKESFFDDFGAFLAAAVSRYSAAPYYVRHYEIWNEPDIDPSLVPGDQLFGCWGDKNDPFYGGEYYGKMLKVVYPMMKSANPNITVMIGGMLMDCDPRNPPPGKDCTPSKFLEGILTAGAKNSFDAVSFHAYDYYNSVFDTFGNPNWHSGKFNNEASGSLRPVLIKKAEFLREVLAQFGATGKILFNTESALLCGGANDPPGEPPCESDDDSPFEIMKASYAAQAFPAAIGENLAANLWFTVFGWRNSGLINSDKTPRPAYHAVDVSEEFLADADYVGKLLGIPNVTGFKFTLPEGNEIWVVWAVNGGPLLLDLPNEPISVTDATGDPVGITGTTVTLTEEPYYVVFP